MRKNSNITRTLILTGIFVILVITKTSAQTNAAALAAADTTAFSVNKQENWRLYNSYAAPVTADSVQLEVIVEHDDNINWSVSSYIGKIKNAAFYPAQDITIEFNLTSTVLEIKVDKNGKCYIRIVSGSLPPGNMKVVPVKIIYKK